MCDLKNTPSIHCLDVDKTFAQAVLVNSCITVRAGGVGGGVGGGGRGCIVNTDTVLLAITTV